MVFTVFQAAFIMRGSFHKETTMPQLHLFYLGGSAGQSNIEVHDVQFAVCDTWQEAIPALKAAWFGDADKIHIDGWQVINWADGYGIQVAPKAATSVSGSLKLYFVNVGGYCPEALPEAHEFGLFVAETAAEAKQKALAALLPHHHAQHKDNLNDVDNVLLLNERLPDWHITLTPNPQGKPAPIGFQGYQPI